MQRERFYFFLISLKFKNSHVRRIYKLRILNILLFHNIRVKYGTVIFLLPLGGRGVFFLFWKKIKLFKRL